MSHTGLTLKQKEISSLKLSSIPLNDAFAMSKDLVVRVEQAWADGFIHGDINRRNIFCGTDGLGLYDFEPYLEVIRDGRFRLQTTRPYVCPFDIQKKEISKTTDKIGLACFLHWFCFDRETPPAKFCHKVLLPQKEVVLEEIFSAFR